MLDPVVIDELRSVQTRLVERGVFPPPEKLEQYYAAFRARFGPERLNGLDGQDLLIAMHGLFRSNRDTMAYWLEFKNDEEFPAIFGSIAGGSALKWGTYPDAQTGQWMGRGQANNPRPISLDEAVGIARRNRDQIIRGVELLAALPNDALDEDYIKLQKAMSDLAPDVSTSAWGHKYFSLLFPTKLDDYHVASHQRFHLVRLLQSDIPEEEAGRYIAAGRFVRLASEFGVPINHFTTILNGRTARPYRYWRMMANSRRENYYEFWPEMMQQGFVAVGWTIGDISGLSKDEVRQRMQDKYHAGPKWVSEVFNFAHQAAPKDLVVAMEGNTALGVGRITGDYKHDGTSQACHRRSAEWLSVEPWELPVPVAQNSYWRELFDFKNQVAVERQVLGRTAQVSKPVTPVRSPEPKGITAQVYNVLERKNQAILYGPPGTGKTYIALTTTRDIAARAAFGAPFGELAEAQQIDVIGGPDSLVQVVTFHPGYAYEDFVEGYRPQVVNGAMHFVLRDGVFKRMAQRAANNPARKYYLLIDEINRGDVPRIFGELLTLLEKDKRGQRVVLPTSSESFAVPANLYIIGTMNTADRAIALLDTALRRRFGFIELMPDISLLGDTVIKRVPIGLWLSELNKRIVATGGKDARNLQIGHAYLMEQGRPITNFTHFARVLQEDIIPLLEEYYYEDYSSLAKVLGEGLVDQRSQRIRHELFEDASRAELIQAILQVSPDLATTRQSVIATPPESSGMDNDMEESSQPDDRD